jgi:hypothetical protein
MHLGHVNDITGEVVGFITLNGFADTVLADYFWARAVILTSPTVATIGMSVTIPIAILTDYIIKGVSATWISILGALLVVIGFILVNLAQDYVDSYVTKIRNRCCPVEAGDGNETNTESRNHASSLYHVEDPGRSNSGEVVGNPLRFNDEKFKMKHFEKITPVS